MVEQIPAPFAPSTGSPVDVKERFYRYFQQECTQLQEQIIQLENYSLVGGEKQDAIDHVLSGITRLADAVADSSSFITAYDQRTYSQAIKGLEEKLSTTRAKIQPKSRFHFKPTIQKNASALSLQDAAELSPKATLAPAPPANIPIMPPNEKELGTLSPLPSFPSKKNYNEELSRPGIGRGVRKPSFSQATNVDISEHNGLHIILPSSASRATASGSLTKLTRCIVDMSVPTSTNAPFAGLAIKNVKTSLIIAGRVAGAAHITGVVESVIVVSSRQVRMHDCRDVDVYLHCASRPIIEDCHNVRFCPIPENYLTPEESEVTNQWDQVDDFKWLKAEHSPNWSILPEDERLSDEIWTKVVPGSPGVGLEDILKKVGIKGR